MHFGDINVPYDTSALLFIYLFIKIRFYSLKHAQLLHIFC